MEISAITDVLGGEKVVRRKILSQFDLIELGNRGIPKKALVHLAGYLSLPMSRMTDLLPVTERTIQRYSSRRRLSKVVSEHILQIAEVAAKGVEVFGDREKFLMWLREPNTALGDNAPVSLLGSRFGAVMVLDELGRIEHGVFS
jgi:putative toxin-antitoxin system antitoxin component (TIGR02293 family)